MEQSKIIQKLKTEFRTLKQISKKQFDERFSTSKHEDKWSDNVFREYKTTQIRIDILLELLLD